jgi:hypothetical protein
MQKKINKYFSVFFLILFLFSLVEKQAHAFQHQNDSHCLATDKHFHNVEHNCSICDFTSTDSNTSTENDFTFIISSSEFSYNAFQQNTNSLKSFHHLPSRAPPVV